MQSNFTLIKIFFPYRRQLYHWNPETQVQLQSTAVRNKMVICPLSVPIK